MRTEFQLKDTRWKHYSLLDGAAEMLIGGVAESLVTGRRRTMGTHSCLPEPDLPQSQAEITVSSNSPGLAAVETDHRVANSLSLAAALLRMQRERSTDPTVREAILSAEARVASIARFHAYLHRHGARDCIDLAEYLREVLPEIGSGIGIHCLLEVRSREPIQVTGRIATQLTVVANELALNALKHGYGGREGGRISFELDGGGEARFRLAVEDGGSGFPNDFDPERGGGLGLRIISMTIRTLGGSIDIQTNAGARFTMSIPKA
jgi:two-component sensor histidine kinase